MLPGQARALGGTAPASGGGDVQPQFGVTDLGQGPPDRLLSLVQLRPPIPPLGAACQAERGSQPCVKQPHCAGEGLSVRPRMRGFEPKPVRTQSPSAFHSALQYLHPDLWGPGGPPPASGRVRRCSLRSQGPGRLHGYSEPSRLRGAAALSGRNWPPGGAVGPCVGRAACAAEPAGRALV